jgi:hypothetical protein
MREPDYNRYPKMRAAYTHFIEFQQLLHDAMFDAYRHDLWTVLSNQLCITLLISGKWMKDNEWQDHLHKVEVDIMTKFESLRNGDSPFNHVVMRTFLRLSFGMTLLSKFLAETLHGGCYKTYQEIDAWITGNSTSGRGICVWRLQFF